MGGCLIRAVTFDFWGTLYRYTRSPRSRRLRHIQAILAAAGRDDIGDEELAEAMQCAWDAWDCVWRVEYRTLDASEWLTLVLDRVGAALPAPLFSRTVPALETAVLADTTVPVEGATAALARLARRYRLGLISDTGLAPGRVLRLLLRRDGLLPHFAHLIFSDEFGRSKPHPAVFRAALNRLAVAPHQAVHVGDLLHTDVAGARGVGMYTVRYAGVRDDRDAAYPDADAVIRNYLEIEPVLARMGAAC